MNETLVNATVGSSVETVQAALPSGITQYTSIIVNPVRGLFESLWPTWGSIVFPLAIAAGLGYYLSKKAFTPNSIWLTFTILIWISLKALGL